MIEVGSRVKYIKKDTAEIKASGFYPPIGTLGTVISVDEQDCTVEVKWDKGTKDGAWWCALEDIMEINAPKGYPIDSGYFGLVDNGMYMLFETEDAYYEYIGKRC